MGRSAYIDESYASAAATYLMAAVVVDSSAAPSAADLARGLRRRSRGQFHWRHELAASRRTMLDLVALVTESQVVVISSPVDPRRQERARARCTGHLLAHLQTMSPPVTAVVFESRGPLPDRRDAERIEGMRTQGRADPAMHYDFATKAEPLLWLADAVAGAAASDLAGTRYLEKLRDRLHRIDVPGVP